MFDLVLATFGPLVLSPLLVLLAVLIKCEDRGPVFYRGTRVGLNGKTFRIFKFRTMVVHADTLGPSSTADDDPRITRIGRILRKYKLDELPELLNVLVGDMSFVGPRPQVQWAVDLYKGEECALLTIRPGITDYASLVFRDEGGILRGCTDPDKDYLEKIAPEKIRLGLEYVRTRSVWLDIKIIVATGFSLVGVDPVWCLPSPPIPERQQPLMPT